MNRRRWVTFSLSTLLLAVTAAAFVFGYARWRRGQALTEYRRLHEAGVGLVMVVDGPAWLRGIVDADFWLRRPRTAEIYLTELSLDEYRLGRDALTWAEAQSRLTELQADLRALGVRDIQVWLYQAAPGLDAQRWGANSLASRERYRAASRRQQQTWEFASAAGMSGGAMLAPNEIAERWKSLQP